MTKKKRVVVVEPVSKDDPEYPLDLCCRLRALSAILPICDEAADLIDLIVGTNA